ncbi:hypothetical protein DCMF_01485 [Candidatus Formimonas warabiya]|uniref:Uncharacterized protein n=1 Tax=Formimonas warabiya TaxID=1761012 RepID=A0A3G1KMG0_FORW1|nr:hypothetical protein DCMF_01485 [Candidatus Formimonas warabiya]
MSYLRNTIFHHIPGGKAKSGVLRALLFFCTEALSHEQWINYFEPIAQDVAANTAVEIQKVQIDNVGILFPDFCCNIVICLNSGLKTIL